MGQNLNYNRLIEWFDIYPQSIHKNHFKQKAQQVPRECCREHVRLMNRKHTIKNTHVKRSLKKKRHMEFWCCGLVGKVIAFNVGILCHHQLLSWLLHFRPGSLIMVCEKQQETTTPAYRQGKQRQAYETMSKQKSQSQKKQQSENKNV